jgi:hypothetical protein
MAMSKAFWMQRETLSPPTVSDNLMMQTIVFATWWDAHNHIGVM